MEKKLKKIIKISLYLFSIVIAANLVVKYVGRRIIVEGSSMEPTLNNQDNLIVEKVTYLFNDPERFDIIVIPARFQTDIKYIKRIIGLPGETVYINENGYIYIDDVLLEETYGKEIILNENRGLAAEKILLGEDEYFVLGDNRNDSLDSRNPAVGKVHRSEIAGHAFLRIWPLSEIKIF